MSDRVISILIVDDHPIVRDGLRGHLETQTDFRVIGEASSAEEALTRLHGVRVDVVITDLRMPGRGGIALIRELRELHPQAHTLVLTTFDTVAEITEALGAGAEGYLLKDAPREEIYAAVRAVASGRTTFGPSISRRIAAAGAAARERPLLSRREVDVLKLVARGLTNGQIARALFVGESTIKTHLQHIFRKLDVPDRAAAVATAYQHGLFREK